MGRTIKQRSIGMKQKIEHLDFYVLKTLKYLEKWEFPKTKIKENDKNIFLGSGSGGLVANLFAQKLKGVSLNISNYERFLKEPKKKLPIYIVSASGGKDALLMAKFLKKRGIKFSLITCNSEAPAKKSAKKTLVFPSFKEPPTYNVSTYSSMIYWLFKENLKEVREIIKGVKIPNLRQYKYIFFLAANKYDTIAKIASMKLAETLEGIGSNGDGFSNSFHGMLRQPNKDRLIFCLNQKYPFKDNTYQLNIDSYLGLMLSTYYIIGRNQTNKDTENLLKNYKLVTKRLAWKFKKIF